MSTPAAATGSDSPKSRADTTGFRCGAAHRDEEFADSANALRFVRSAMPLAAWLLLGKRPQQASSPVRAPLVPGTVAGRIALVFVPHKLIDELCTSDRYSRFYYEKYGPSSSGGAPPAATRVSTAEENR